MAISLLLLGGAAALGYALLMKSPEPGAVTPQGPMRAQTTVPTVDGKGYVLTATPADIAAIMAMAQGGNAHNLRVMGAQYRAEGKFSEEEACKHLAAIIEAGQAVPKASSPGIVQSSGGAVSVATQPPPELIARLVAATAAQDSVKMRAIAIELRMLGFGEQAATVVSAADTVDKLKVVVMPGPAAGTSAPVSVVVPTAQVIPTPTARRNAADMLVRHLTVSPPAKGKESAAIVSAYQAAAGQKVDDKYGPGTAKTLADPASGEHVPPSPRKWPKGTYAKALQEYQSWLAIKQSQDPARAAEWSVALERSKEFYP